MEKLKQIIALFEASSLDQLKYKDDSVEVELRCSSSSANFSSSDGNGEKTIEKDEKISKYYQMTCPTVGVFYRRPSPQAPNYVEVGDRVNKGDILCTLEAMKVFSEVKSPVTGIIRRIALEDGEVAGEGEVLFEMELC
ncbi:MAG: biotin/lipoyl-containing protein [Tissierellia bacterium]|nr:biotin/lipoyl-containing protein [Tissierellia bacterium]